MHHTLYKAVMGKIMNIYMSVAFILIVCFVVLFIGATRKKMEWLLNIVMRGILGTISIYFMNGGLAAVGISVGVGINAVSVLTSAILGIPGVLALYGIEIYTLL